MNVKYFTCHQYFTLYKDVMNYLWQQYRNRSDGIPVPKPDHILSLFAQR